MVLSTRIADQSWEVFAGVKKGERIYVARSDYSEKPLLNAAKFLWCKGKQLWWSTNQDNAAKLIKYADFSCKSELEAITKKQSESIILSKAVDSDIDIPCNEGMAYLGYQKAGIHYGVERRNVLIADEPGLGKTIQAIGIINATDTKTALIICPASLKINWLREMKKWLVRKYSIGIGGSDCFPKTDIVIINFDNIHKHQEIKNVVWDVLVIDECHKIKNPKTIRGKAVYGAPKNKKTGEDAILPIGAKRNIFMSGTPICNNPSEIFPIIQHLDRATWGGKWFYFMTKYCNAHNNGYGYNIKGANEKNLPELQEILRKTIMVRRLKSEVLKELPPKNRQIIEIEPESGIKSGILAECRAINDKIDTLKENIELAKTISEEAYRDAVSKLEEAFKVSFEETAKIRHDTAVMKIPYAIEFIEGLVESGLKVVVGAHHKDVISKVKAHFGNICVTLDGDTKLENRQKAVDMFQDDPKTMVFVGSILAAGVGITLTASSNVVMIEYPWTPGDLTQYEDRVHRKGQKNSVNIYHIVLTGSIDVKMVKLIVKKQQIADAALDKEIKIDEECSTENCSVKTIETDALRITESQSEAIHLALKIVAGNCDGARRADGAGFSMLDTRIGKSLSDCASLTKKQAALGLKIALKYKRQIPEEIYKEIKGLE